MNREDIKIGEKYKVVAKRDYDYEEGEIITISSPHTGNDNWFKTKEKGIVIHCSNFEPVNKFEVGDEVVYTIKNEKCRYCGETSDDLAILEDKNEYLFRVNYNHLSPLKKKNELEVRDKFVSVDDIEHIVCGKEYSDNDEVMFYLAKSIPSGNIYLIDEFGIKEIIYD